MTEALSASDALNQILVVDDHRVTVNLLTDLLRSAFPGMVTATAATSGDAVRACRTRLPRVVVMDIALADESGIDAVRVIRAMSQEVVVVMHSNHDHGVYRQESAAAGADAFVSKSRTYAELVPTIAGLLERGRFSKQRGSETS